MATRLPRHRKRNRLPRHPRYPPPPPPPPPLPQPLTCTFRTSLRWALISIAEIATGIETAFFIIQAGEIDFTNELISACAFHLYAASLAIWVTFFVAIGVLISADDDSKIPEERARAALPAYSFDSWSLDSWECESEWDYSALVDTEWIPG